MKKYNGYYSEKTSEFGHCVYKNENGKEVIVNCVVPIEWEDPRIPDDAIFVDVVVEFVSTAYPDLRKY